MQEFWLQPCASHSSAGGVNVQETQLAEMGLLEEPVFSMGQRVANLLAEWPDNPLLMQLKAICQRLLGMPLAPYNLPPPLPPGSGGQKQVLFS